MRTRVRQVLCIEAVLLPCLGVATVFACKAPSEQLFLWGMAGNAISMVYYGAPLSTMAQVRLWGRSGPELAKSFLAKGAEVSKDFGAKKDLGSGDLGLGRLQQKVWACAQEVPGCAVKGLGVGVRQRSCISA